MVSPKTLNEYEKPLGIALFDLDFEELSDLDEDVTEPSTSTTHVADPALRR